MVPVDIEAEYRAHLGDLLHFATVLVGPHDAADVVNEAVTATLRPAGTEARGATEGTVKQHLPEGGPD